MLFGWKVSNDKIKINFLYQIKSRKKRKIQIAKKKKIQIAKEKIEKCFLIDFNGIPSTYLKRI